MESYRIDCYYEFGGERRRVRRNLATLEECRRFASENDGVDVLSGGSSCRVPFVDYEIVRTSQEVVETGGYGEVRKA